MSPAIFCTSMSGMLVTFISHFQFDRRQRGKSSAYFYLARIHCGNVFLNGRTLTSPYTPAPTYGSLSAHSRAAVSEVHSATIKLPVNPAEPGSSASNAGKG